VRYLVRAQRASWLLVLLLWSSVFSLKSLFSTGLCIRHVRRSSSIMHACGYVIDVTRTVYNRNHRLLVFLKTDVRIRLWFQAVLSPCAKEDLWRWIHEAKNTPYRSHWPDFATKAGNLTSKTVRIASLRVRCLLHVRRSSGGEEEKRRRRDIAVPSSLSYVDHGDNNKRSTFRSIPTGQKKKKSRKNRLSSALQLTATGTASRSHEPLAAHRPPKGSSSFPSPQAASANEV